MLGAIAHSTYNNCRCSLLTCFCHSELRVLVPQLALQELALDRYLPKVFPEEVVRKVAPAVALVAAHRHHHALVFAVVACENALKAIAQIEEVLPLASPSLHNLGLDRPIGLDRLTTAAGLLSQKRLSASSLCVGSQSSRNDTLSKRAEVTVTNHLLFVTVVFVDEARVVVIVLLVLEIRLQHYTHQTNSGYQKAYRSDGSSVGGTGLSESTGDERGARCPGSWGAYERRAQP